MNEQELLEAISGHVSFGNMQPVMDAAKAYADAREKETKRQLGLCNLMQSAATDMLCAKDTEIAELKAANKLSSSSWRKDCEERDDKITQLNAEIKRLRDGIQKGFEKLAEIPYCSVLRTIFDNANGVQNGLESLLSPAPVTETLTEDQE